MSETLQTILQDSLCFSSVSSSAVNHGSTDRKKKTYLEFPQRDRERAIPLELFLIPPRGSCHAIYRYSRSSPRNFRALVGRISRERATMNSHESSRRPDPPIRFPFHGLPSLFFSSTSFHSFSHVNHRSGANDRNSRYSRPSIPRRRKEREESIRQDVRLRL